MFKKKKKKMGERGWQHLNKKKIKKKGSNIGSCPQVPVFHDVFLKYIYITDY